MKPYMDKMVPCPFFQCCILELLLEHHRWNVKTLCPVLHGPRNALSDCSPNQTHLPGIQLPAWMSAEKGNGFIFNAYTRLCVGGWTPIYTEQQYTQLKYLDFLATKCVHVDKFWQRRWEWNANFRRACLTEAEPGGLLLSWNVNVITGVPAAILDFR